MEITINGEARQLVGNPPAVGEEFPHFKVYDKNDEKIKTRQLLGKVTLLSVVPNINTPVCSIQTKHFNSTMDQFPDVNFLTISTNTIEDQQKWCAAEGVKHMQLASDKDESFGYESKLLIPDEGILARSVWILDQNGKIVYREILKELTDEPNYDQALSELKKLVWQWKHLIKASSYKGTFNVRITPELHRDLVNYADDNEETLNAAVTTAIENLIQVNWKNFKQLAPVNSVRAAFYNLLNKHIGLTVGSSMLILAVCKIKLEKGHLW